MKALKKTLSAFLSLLLLFSLAACSSREETPKSDGIDMSAVSFDQLQLGDYSDLTADIKILTGRTDYVDNIFQDYIAQFNEIYPNIKITYEGISDYDQTATTRLTNPDWGDLCSIPTTVDTSELANYFVPYGDVDKLSEKYNFCSFKALNGKCYGISMVGNMQGIVYNKRVFEEAGIQELPKTPDEFINALRQIREKTDATPLYTLFGSQWPMVFWDSFIGGTATGDPDFMNTKLAQMSNPFAPDAFPEGVGPYAVYNILYTAVSEGLVEEDPATSDFETSLSLINQGKIGVIVIGCGAISSMQAAGPNAEDIAYMPFPISVNGQQYATINSDYCYGINVNSSAENQLASMLYVKWLTEESGYYNYVGGVPVCKEDPLPEELFQNFTDVIMLEDNPAPADIVDLYSKVNNGSELSLNSDIMHVMNIVESAMLGDKTMDEIMAQWNSQWTQAQVDSGVNPS